MHRAYELTRWFVSQQPNLTESEKDRLCLTAMVHDWAEAIDGDVPDPEKTVDTTPQEMRSFITVASSVTEPHTLAQKVFPIMFNKKSKLGAMFRAVEVMGYMETGLKAAEQVEFASWWAGQFGLTYTQADDLKKALTTMGQEVNTRCLTQLTPLKEKYPAVKAWLHG